MPVLVGGSGTFDYDAGPSQPSPAPTARPQAYWPGMLGYAGCVDPVSAVARAVHAIPGGM